MAITQALSWTPLANIQQLQPLISPAPTLWPHPPPPRWQRDWLESKGFRLSAHSGRHQAILCPDTSFCWGFSSWAGFQLHSAWSAAAAVRDPHCTVTGPSAILGVAVVPWQGLSK